jgi:cytochrome c-type biogenesis protein CcmF
MTLWGAIAVGALSLGPGLSPRLARRLLLASLALAGASTLILTVALLGTDYSLAYVGQTTTRATPWPYKLAALWGGMEGSMLFYAFVTLVVGVIGIQRFRGGPWAFRIVALVGVGYLLITATVADPFVTLDIPAIDGIGLFGILQNPAMVYHPPILYLGLTALVVPFALTVDAAARGALDRAWLRTTRRSLYFPWTLLTLGMVAGANWAYIELGWGGFWAWDPVENTSLMPWLAATVFLHTSRIQERDGRLRRWNAGFALLPFVLTILGVYLTRSGVTGSIHSFAEDPVIGKVLLSVAAAAGVASFVLVLRAPRGKAWAKVGLGRDTWVASGGVLLAFALLVITVGSAYPAYANVFLGRLLTVDSRFFLSMTYPLAVLLVFGLSFALKTRWSRLGLDNSGVRLFVGVAALVALLGLVGPGGLVPVGLLSLAVGAAVLLMRDLVKVRPRRRLMVAYLAHLGFVLVLAGAAGSALGEDFIGTLAPGDQIEVGGHTLRLEEVITGETERFLFVRSTFTVDGEDTMVPEIRAYERQPLPISEPALRSNLAGDLIVATSRLNEDGVTVNISVFSRPLVWLVWLGAVLITLAGMLALVARTGGAAERRRPATAGLQSAGTTSGSSAR